MTERLRAKFKDYALYHTHPLNRVSHYIGVPLIVVSLMGLFGLIRLGPLDLGMILAGFGFIFYFSLDRKLAVFFLPPLALSYYLGSQLSVPALMALQASGWISQYVGHLTYEKKSPAFYKNLEHLFIGPLWVFSKSIKYK